MVNRVRVYSCLLIGSLLFAACQPAATTPRKTSPRDDISYPLKDFTLVERSGKKVSKADLLGRVWIASFVFTRCTGTCPQITGTMARLQSEFAKESDVRLVTFTVDPARDDPNELRKYAENFRADKERWLFLTGEEKTIHRLLKESFKIPVARNDMAKNPSDEFGHSTRLVVVDRQGQVRGYYQGMADPSVEGSAGALKEDLDKLKEKVGELLREKP